MSRLSIEKEWIENAQRSEKSAPEIIINLGRGYVKVSRMHFLIFGGPKEIDISVTSKWHSVNTKPKTYGPIPFYGYTRTYEAYKIDYQVARKYSFIYFASKIHEFSNDTVVRACLYHLSNVGIIIRQENVNNILESESSYLGKRYLILTALFCPTLFILMKFKTQISLDENKFDMDDPFYNNRGAVFTLSHIENRSFKKYLDSHKGYFNIGYRGIVLADHYRYNGQFKLSHEYFKIATTYISSSIERNQRNSDAFLLRSFSNLMMKNYEASIQDALVVHPHWANFSLIIPLYSPHLLCDCYNATKDHQKALQYLLEANIYDIFFKKYNSNKERIVDTLFSLNMYVDAIAISTEIQEQHRGFYFNHFLILIALKRYQESNEYFQTYNPKYGRFEYKYFYSIFPQLVTYLIERKEYGYIKLFYLNLDNKGQELFLNLIINSIR